MSNLEGLVPSLDLCRKIPFPKFEDSVFVWDKEDGWLSERNNVCCDEDEEANYVPAPTLQEILEDLAKLEKCPEVRAVFAANGKVIYTFQADGKFNQGDSVNDAMKLWLKWNKNEEKNENDEPKGS